MIAPLISKFYLFEKRRQFRDFVPFFPAQIDIETSNLCNLRCQFCPLTKQTRKMGLMSFELACKAIDEITRYGLERMCLGGFGEPLLNKDFFEISRYAAATGKIKQLYISTHGLLMDNRANEELLDCGLDKIIVSIDGATPKTYERMRLGGNYNEVVSNVLEFIKIRRQYQKLKPILAVQIIRMQDTISEVNDFVNFWQDKIAAQDEINIKEYFTWAGKVSDNSVSNGYRIEVKVPCLIYLWSNLIIQWNGDISACCYDANGDLVLGNIETDSIYDIWHSNKYKELRMKHLRGQIENIPVCATCELTHRKLSIIELLQATTRRFIPKKG